MDKRGLLADPPLLVHVVVECPLTKQNFGGSDPTNELHKFKIDIALHI